MEQNNTSEQEDYIVQIINGKLIILQARAGTGKTSTQINLFERVPNKRCRIVVFNKKNEVEMAPKLPTNCIGKTWNGFMYSNFKLKGVRLNEWKVTNIIQEIDGYNYKREITKEGKEKATECKDSLKELVNLLKSSYIRPTTDDALKTMDHYGITSAMDRNKLAEDSIKVLEESDQKLNEIDFNDQIRFPIIFNWLKPDCDILITDECQDNTMLRTEACRILREKGCQIGSVGDEKQAIYGFAGSDCDSMKHLKEIVGLEEMPLTINFRCGKKIIEAAQALVPDIKAWENSPDGEIGYFNKDNLLKSLQPGDCVVSRRNRDIISICFQLIKEGKKATIQGADFAKQLKALIDSFKANDIQDFNEKINEWYQKQIKFRGESEITLEKFDVLKFFADNAITMSDVDKKIAMIFSDEASEYKLSTAHKAKGLEWERVFMLNASNFSINNPKMQQWQRQQEVNLRYVAITRAKRFLGFVD